MIPLHRIAAWLVLIVAIAEVRADPIDIDRVGPPSWWSSGKRQDVTLLIEGSGLRAAKVTTDRKEIEVRSVESPSEDGSSLFVDLFIAANTVPGPVTLTIEVDGRHMTRIWQLLARPAHRPDPIGADDVLYLVMPDRFANGDPSNDRAEFAEDMLDRSNPHAYQGGDFAGLKARLPYLKDLGVTGLWLTPVYKAAPRWFRTHVSGKDRAFADFHGYSPIDFYETNPRFGSLDEYKSLVGAAHALGLKVIQDQILGYTGPQHRWMTRPPAGHWFHGPMDSPPACNFRFAAAANPHALESDRLGLTDGWFFGILPDLDTKNDRVKRYALQQSLWWTTLFAADGVRLDTYPMVDRPFWRDWSAAHVAGNPRFRAVGEAWTNDPADLSFFQGGRPGWDGIDPGIASVFDFPLNLAIVEVTSKKSPATNLPKALSRDGLFSRPDLLVTFLDNHDTPRLASSPNVTAARHRLAAAFLLTSRGIPQITWGDEIGLGGHSDDRRTIPGAWPGDDRDAFSDAGRSADEKATFAAYRSLLHLRRDHDALRLGRTVDLFADSSVYAYLRETDDERIVIVLNFGATPARVRLPSGPIGDANAFSTLWGEGRLTCNASGLIADVPAETAAVFR